MAVLFALGAAIAWGSSDFAAGLASRKSSAVSVVVLTHLASVVVLLAIAFDIGSWPSGGTLLPSFHGAPEANDLGWGIAAGLGGGFGSMLLFRGLGRGAMAVVAPITAVGAAAIPVAAGVGLGETLRPIAVAGIVIAIGAIVLISLSGTDEDEVSEAPPAVLARVPAAEQPVTAPEPAAATVSPPSRFLDALRAPGVSDALLSGVGFGLFFICISRTADTAGHWPLIAARSTSVLLFVAVALVTTVTVLPARGSRMPVVVAGMLDAVAAVAFVLAARQGLLSVGAVIASLYPGATIVLARAVAKERIRREQLAGLALAGVAVALLAI